MSPNCHWPHDTVEQTPSLGPSSSGLTHHRSPREASVQLFVSSTCALLASSIDRCAQLLLAPVNVFVAVYAMACATRGHQGSVAHLGQKVQGNWDVHAASCGAHGG